MDGLGYIPPGERLSLGVPAQCSPRRAGPVPARRWPCAGPVFALCPPGAGPVFALCPPGAGPVRIFWRSYARTFPTSRMRVRPGAGPGAGPGAVRAGIRDIVLHER